MAQSDVNRSNTILLVEDDSEVAAAVGDILGQLGFGLIHCADGKLGLEQALAREFALVVLDIRLPSLDGLEICKRLRAARPNQAILMLTGESDEMSTVLGLELGADEYITKPFRAKEFRARVSALLRRYQTTHSAPPESNPSPASDAPAEEAGAASVPADEPSSTGNRLRVDQELQAVMYDGTRIPLTPTEYRLFLTLFTHKNRVFSNEQLTSAVLGYDSYADPSERIRAHVSRLRRKLIAAGLPPSCIWNELGFGYRFQDDT